MTTKRFFPVAAEVFPYAEKSTISGSFDGLHVEVTVVGARPVFQAEQWADLFRELADGLVRP